jgi:SAM-dependent methyltransferase
VAAERLEIVMGAEATRGDSHIIVDPGGRLATDQLAVFDWFRQLVRLEEAVIVEVGGRLPDDTVANTGVRRWWSIDPRNASATSDESAVVRTVRGHASKVPLADGDADHVFSCNAFQHISDVAATFAELARVLRPGGLFYANFGPVWSAPDGSHIEGLFWEGHQYNFWTETLLPAWSHLLLGEAQLAELLTPLHGRRFGKHIAKYVYRSKWINRMLLADYLRVIRASAFDIVYIRGTAEFGYSYNPPVVRHPLAIRLRPERVTDALCARFGMCRSTASIRDVEWLLRRRPE